MRYKTEKRGMRGIVRSGILAAGKNIFIFKSKTFSYFCGFIFKI
jgi:hypothetical protein